MKKQGFTIVELLIVMIVIAILAAISIFAYSSTQAKARDATRIEHLEKIAEAIQMYRTKYGNDIQTGSSCGSGGGGQGWFNYDNDGTYPDSILSCLTSRGYLDNTFTDPSGCITNGGGCSGKGGYMKYTCTYNGQTVSVLYAHLETQDQSSQITNFNGGVSTCNSGTVVGSYGMNYMVIAD